VDCQRESAVRGVWFGGGWDLPALVDVQSAYRTFAAPGLPMSGKRRDASRSSGYIALQPCGPIRSVLPAV
jgi:hypothetical protein